MKAVPFSEIPAHDWDALCDASDEAWLFHRSAWVAFEAAHGSVENHSFGLLDGGRLAAVAPLYGSQLGLGPFVETLVHDGHHRHTGLASAPDLAAGEARAVRTAWMTEISRVAGDLDADRIHLARQNLTPSSLSPTREEIPFWVMEHGFQLGQGYGPAGLAPAPGMATAVADQIVPLEGSEEELFAGLKDSCRRAVRKASKAGARADDVTGQEDAVESYYRIAELSAARTGEQLPPIDFYRAVRAALAPSERCTFLTVNVDGANASASILVHDKGAVHFLSGVSDPAFLDRRVNDFLHWSAICLARERGCSHYRLGPYFPAVPKGWPIETVSRFKTKFGARPWTIVQGSSFRKPRRYVEIGQAQLARLCEELEG
jgi:hypothetical protein